MKGERVMLKKMLVGIVAVTMLLCTAPMVHAGGAFLGNAQSSDSVSALGGDRVSFLGQSAGYNSGATVEAEAAAGSLLNFRATADTKVKAIGGIGDTDIDLINLGYKHGVGFTNTVKVGAEGTGIGSGKAEAKACGLLSAAYGKVEVTAFQENWSNAENHNLFDWNGDYGMASAYNTSTATSVTEKLDVGIFSADVKICDFALTHGETVTWVTVGNNYTQSGAFSGNNYGIGDKTTAEGNVAQMAVATGQGGQGIASGTASFAGADGFAASVGTVQVSRGIVTATSHSHAETGAGGQVR